MIILGSSVDLELTLVMDGTVIDLTDCTNTMLYVQSPDEVVHEIVPDIEAPTLGLITHSLSVEDANQTGIWGFWAECDLPGGGHFVSAAEEFTIYPKRTVNVED